MNTITLTHTPSVVDRARRLTLAVLAAVIGLLSFNAAESLAAGHVAYNSVVFGDCRITASVYTDSGYVAGGGNANCSRVHGSTLVHVTLKRNGAAYFPPAPTQFYNSYGMGTRWLWTPWARAGCANWQTVVQFNISGIGQSYITTGAPKMVC